MAARSIVPSRRLAPILACLLLVVLGTAGPARAEFGFPSGPAGFSTTASAIGGGPATLAGSHPETLGIEIAFNLGPESEGQPGVPFSDGDVKDLRIDLPPGLIENPTVVPACSQVDFHSPRSSPYGPSLSGESCPDESQIGTIALHTGGLTRYFGLFNLTPAPGHPSRFGASPFGSPLVFSTSPRQVGGEYGLSLESRNLSQLYDLTGVELEIWGVPWGASHDGRRGDCLNESGAGSPHGLCPIDFNKQSHSTWAYLTLPSDCSAPLSFSLAADSWQQPGGYLPNGDPDLSQAAWKHTEFQSPALQDCGGLGFFATATVKPTTNFVSSPTGLAFHLDVNQAELRALNGRLASRVKQAVVALPAGLTINPSVGAGLGACTPAQFGAETPSSAPGAGCPNPSKIGLVTLETPLFDGVLTGSLFIAKPFENPFGSPYALYFVAKSPERGLIVKVAGKLEADPATGRLTATFDNLPQLPYTNLKVDFREGQRAPLVSPATCGTHTAQIALHPWTNPEATVQQASSFALTRGITSGGACPAAGTEPFAPGVNAGTLNSNSGSYTPFYLRLTRADYEQELTTYSTALPPGLLGSIAAVPFCPDAAIEAAKSRTGTAELQSPSCPAASEIGHTYSGYGVGLAPAYAPGRFYLAGPYRGAPLSVVAVNSAIVGPFDLGTIVIRSAVRVDSHSAQVALDSSSSDPIPHIFAGIPLHLRDVRVYIDRPNFMLNPTNCSPLSIASTMTGSRAPFTNPRDAVVTGTVPYQVSSCSERGFAPSLALGLKGGTTRGNYPTLKAVMTSRPGDANLASAAVTLPPSLFLAQNHIGDICTRVQFSADACPPRSVIGSARAETPLMAEPMEGSVYLRSSDNLLPDLVAVLRGRGVRIVVEGRIDSSHGGIRATFAGLPDAPVSKFTMTIFGGRKRGILVNSDNLCRSSQPAVARMIGQNNAGVVLKPKLIVKCRKAERRKRSTKGAGGRGR
jgi:hypothetical protein